MDALYPRLLVRDFPAAVAFYRAALGVEPVKVLTEAAYANWDIDGQAGLVLFGRDNMAHVVGTAGLPAAPAQDTAMLVMKVDDVDAGTDRLVRLGAVVVAPPQDRPAWAPGLRTAHLRDPEGNLIELQSY
ncbi:glyoxalase/bleomycin resistance/extradiol dioxygenase family protein [Nonomuraea sp. WAC 01424]|uniref:VOC family protein n=1 Tax=Nonomuraea sp. WAC 01424 TaxID=2203200 RepID=UPI000F77B1D2|nr:VOC family protein [Nonomuraea sp. WAC 01424]RSN14321.1 glyoxalase/bleomycin resistance/extradiol dioxygenase family protein [Nonomuraea sp. WAC 01424]